MEAQQCVQLTGTNSSFGLIALINQRPSIWTTIKNHLLLRAFLTLIDQMSEKKGFIVCLSPAWWLLRSGQTQFHPELGRQTLQRQWYFVSRHGRVGRRQACQRQTIASSQNKNTNSGLSTRPLFALPTQPFTAGWSSPVARQAHNLKVAGSNPAPATTFERKKPKDINHPWAFLVLIPLFSEIIAADLARNFYPVLSSLWRLDLPC